MFSPSNMFDLFSDELSRLRRRRFALPFRLAGPLNCLLLRHGLILSLKIFPPVKKE